MTTAADTYTMLPYRRMGEIDYDILEFDPGVSAEKPEAMEQQQPQDEIISVLSAFFTEFNQRPDVLLSRDSFICYNPNDLNVRVSPDAYLAFGVDAHAIRPNLLYLPWEVGKPPDWALEVGSSSTKLQDIYNKPGIYARIGIPEYWMFDATGGRYYGAPIIGLLLSEDGYQPVELTSEPDGILKGYSPTLQLYLAWDNGRPRFYNPATGTYLTSWQEEREILEQERAGRLRVTAQRDAAEAQREVAESRQDAAKAQRDAANTQREAAETQRDTANAQRDTANAQRETAETERETERAARLSAEAELERLREQIRRQSEP